MKIERFEDLECWKEARKLVKMVYDAINASPAFKRDRGLCDQATSAAVSLMSNIAEGFSRHSNKEFIQFLFVSKSSASEVQSLSYVALDESYIPAPTFQAIYDQADLVSKLDSGLITYLLSTQKAKAHKQR